MSIFQSYYQTSSGTHNACLFLFNLASTASQQYSYYSPLFYSFPWLYISWIKNSVIKACSLFQHCSVFPFEFFSLYYFFAFITLGHYYEISSFNHNKTRLIRNQSYRLYVSLKVILFHPIVVPSSPNKI